VPPEDGKVMLKHVEALSFNKVQVIMKCIKLVRFIKLYHDAGQQNIKFIQCLYRTSFVYGMNSKLFL
jgi:hypothetical protein